MHELIIKVAACFNTKFTTTNSSKLTSYQSRCNRKLEYIYTITQIYSISIQHTSTRSVVASGAKVLLSADPTMESFVK